MATHKGRGLKLDLLDSTCPLVLRHRWCQLMQCRLLVWLKIQTWVGLAGEVDVAQTLSIHSCIHNSNQPGGCQTVVTESEHAESEEISLEKKQHWGLAHSFRLCMFRLILFKADLQLTTMLKKHWTALFSISDQLPCFAQADPSCRPVQYYLSFAHLRSWWCLVMPVIIGASSRLRTTDHGSKSHVPFCIGAVNKAHLNLAHLHFGKIGVPRCTYLMHFGKKQRGKLPDSTKMASG